jgi:YggT family protein
VVFLDYITEPILAPLRRVIPRIGMIDITPMVAIIILIVIARII